MREMKESANRLFLKVTKGARKTKGLNGNIGHRCIPARSEFNRHVRELMTKAAAGCAAVASCV